VLSAGGVRAGLRTPEHRGHAARGAVAGSHASDRPPGANTGGADYNDQLGQQRAEAVRRYLAREHKLPLGRISTISYGDTQPVETNKTAKGRTQNRRVVIVVLE